MDKNEYEVFISWSTKYSGQVAFFLQEIILDILKIEAYISDRNIVLGKNWFQNLKETLAQTKICVVCITNENQRKPWLLFESGIIYRNNFEESNSGVFSIFIDIKGLPEKHPLSHFQGEEFTKEGVKILLEEINGILKAVDTKIALKNFNKLWDKVYKQRFNELKK